MTWMTGTLYGHPDTTPEVRFSNEPFGKTLIWKNTRESMKTQMELLSPAMLPKLSTSTINTALS